MKFVSFADTFNSQDTSAFPHVADSDCAEEVKISFSDAESESLRLNSYAADNWRHSHDFICSMETLESSIVSNKNQRFSPVKDEESKQLEMYDSLTDGQTFQRPQFDFATYRQEQLVPAIKAEADAFKQRHIPDDSSDSARSSDWESEASSIDNDDGTDMPKTFRSEREARLYLGRGYKVTKVHV